MDPGTGKTKVVLDLAQLYCHTSGERLRVLVVCPKTIIDVWIRQANSHLCNTIDWSISEIRRATSDAHFDAQLSIRVISYDLCWRREQMLSSYDWDMIVADESHYIKNRTARRSKALHRLGRDIPMRVIMTGTHIVKSPLDVFSQFKFLRSEIFGTSWKRFREQYAIMGGYYGKEVVGFQNLEELRSKVHSVAIVKRKEECLDLPPKIHENIYLDLDKQARSVYEGMAEEMVVWIEQNAESLVGFAQIALTKMLRLSQITGGFLPTEDEQGHKDLTTIHLNKIEAAVDLISSLTSQGERVVVFCRFLWEIEMLRERLGETELVLTLQGSTPNRGGVVDRFEEFPASVLIAQLQVGGLGLNLQCASHCVFYSLSFSFADYHQAQDRLHRIGQTKAVNYYTLVARHTMDEVVLEAIQTKRSLLETVLADPTQLTTGSQ